MNTKCVYILWKIIHLCLPCGIIFHAYLHYAGISLWYHERNLFSFVKECQLTPLFVGYWPLHIWFCCIKAMIRMKNLVYKYVLCIYIYTIIRTLICIYRHICDELDYFYCDIFIRDRRWIPQMPYDHRHGSYLTKLCHMLAYIEYE